MQGSLANQFVFLPYTEGVDVKIFLQRISNSQNGTDGEAAGAVLDVLVALWKDLYMVKKGDNPRKKKLANITKHANITSEKRNIRKVMQKMLHV